MCMSCSKYRDAQKFPITSSSICSPVVTVLLVMGAGGWQWDLFLLVPGVPHALVPGSGLAGKGIQKFLKLGWLWGLFLGLREILPTSVGPAFAKLSRFISFLSFPNFPIHIFSLLFLCGCPGSIEERFGYYISALYSLNHDTDLIKINPYYLTIFTHKNWCSDISVPIE